MTTLFALSSAIPIPTDLLNTSTIMATASAGATADVGMVENASEVEFQFTLQQGEQGIKGIQGVKGNPYSPTIARAFSSANKNAPLHNARSEALRRGAASRRASGERGRIKREMYTPREPPPPRCAAARARSVCGQDPSDTKHEG